jgi:hypothetical protein
MSCSGWADGFTILGPCSQAWFTFAIVLFLALILRRQCIDGFLAGTGYNIWGAFIIGLGANFLVTILIGQARWSLLAGLGGLILGGFGLGALMDTTSEAGGEDYYG